MKSFTTNSATATTAVSSTATTTTNFMATTSTCSIADYSPTITYCMVNSSKSTISETKLYIFRLNFENLCLI